MSGWVGDAVDAVKVSDAAWIEGNGVGGLIPTEGGGMLGLSMDDGKDDGLAV